MVDKAWWTPQRFIGLAKTEFEKRGFSDTEVTFYTGVGGWRRTITIEVVSKHEDFELCAVGIYDMASWRNDVNTFRGFVLGKISNMSFQLRKVLGNKSEPATIKTKYSSLTVHDRSENAVTAFVYKHSRITKPPKEYVTTVVDRLLKHKNSIATSGIWNSIFLAAPAATLAEEAEEDCAKECL